MPIVLGLNRLRNRGCVSVWSHDRQLVYCLVTTRVAYIAAGYRLQPALATAAATLVRVKEGNEWKAAFVMHKGDFEPLVMYFGLCNSPATFQKMMNEIFHDMSDVCIVYIDDLMIFTTSDNQEEHNKIMLEVL